MIFRMPFLAEVVDKFSRENFKYLDKKVFNDAVLKGRFVFFERALEAAVYPATLNVFHGLDFIPADVIQTSFLGGTVTWNYSLFTRTYVSVTISAAVTVRFYLGRYEE